MYDLDGEVAYVGQSSQLRSRLRQHFIRQDSSVVSYGRLDIWDIAYVDWWETEKTDAAENELLMYHQPYLNFDGESSAPLDNPPVDVEQPTESIQLLTEEELKLRTRPYNRAKQKLEHLVRMIDKIHLAGHSKDTKRTLYEHNRIFQEAVSEFLGVE